MKKYNQFAIVYKNGVKPIMAPGHRGWYKKEIRSIARKWLRENKEESCRISFGDMFPIGEKTLEEVNK